MKVIATYNIKGGVGKTATAVNLAWLAAQEGAPTLIWDLDPQGAASYYFRIKPRIKGSGKKLLQGKRDLEQHIRGTDYDWLDLLPADFSYRNMDIFFDHTKRPEQQLRKLLKPFRHEYYYVFLDCPPNITLTSENVFAAADALLLPTIPTTLSLRTYQQILHFFDKNHMDKKKLLPFFTMVDRRKQLHRSIVDQPEGVHDDFLATRIPYHSEVELMGVHRAPVVDFAPASPSARSYAALWDEIKQKLVSYDL
ncbi:MAG: AAA family ATPase [Thiohalobacterales bacterium]|nr:AAA family ATPase [Thiohalobacterales bacterium]